MIGPGWAPEPAGGPEDDGADRARRVAVVTGSRAEFGLLRPVMRAIAARADLDLLVVASGSHLVQPALTFRDVKAEFAIADSVPMQTAGQTGRERDVQAVGRGIARFGRSFELLRPDWVVVLGDRIEAFAAASAASIGGWALVHLHGGDRAEGVADEAMRHAITKLAHLHLAATEESGERIRKMGERASDVRVVGSPAIDGLGAIEALPDERFEALGAPEAVVLFHPIGRPNEAEEHATEVVLRGLAGLRVTALHPNYDAGREGVLRALLSAPPEVKVVEHLPRDVFVGLLRRVAGAGGCLVGNSSAGLIECAAIGCPAVDVGARQAGREHAPGAVHRAGEDPDAIRDAVELARSSGAAPWDHPFGAGDAGVRVAAALAEVNPGSGGLLRKRCVY